VVVECSADSIVFHRPEADEHRYRIAMPLPDHQERLDAVRGELQLRPIAFAGRSAA
jgi:hypothetical protein